MSYFAPSFSNFFKELSQKNSTEWFNNNRKTYEKQVKEPFASFVFEMISRIQKFEPEVTIKPPDAIARINKDIRFSKDKTPYNTHVAANISPYGKKDKSYPGFFFQLSHEKIEIYGGAYMVEPAQLTNIRNYIAANLETFAEAYNDKKFKEKFGTIQGDKNKRLPEEFQVLVNKEPLIANKQFYYKAELEPGLIEQNTLADVLMEYYEAGKKVNDFLRFALQGI